MFISFGTKLYGKVDVVPGLGFVATKFFNVMLLPIVPLGSWFVEEGSEGPDESGEAGWKGVQIAVSWKSVLFAYGRVVALIAAFVLGLMAIPGLDKGPMSGLLPGLLAGVCIIAVILSYVLNRASLARAEELAEKVGIPREEVKARYRRLPGA